jgi:phage shock protein C
MQVNRRLYRCRHNRRIAGVAAGVAEFFELDPTLVRVLWFLSIFVGGFSILLYIGLAIIVPLEPLSADEAAHEAEIAPGEGHRHVSRGTGRLTMYVGIALILFGGLALLDVLLPSVVSWRYLWPLFIVGIGAVLIVGSIRREPTDS